MNEMKKKYYAKRGAVLVNQLKSRHFDAYYCETKEDALRQARDLCYFSLTFVFRVCRHKEAGTKGEAGPA